MAAASGTAFVPAPTTNRCTPASGGGGGTVENAFENDDVSVATSFVAVADTKADAFEVFTVRENVPSPAPSVITDTVPSGLRPSPKPDPSAAVLPKSSTV